MAEFLSTIITDLIQKLSILFMNHINKSVVRCLTARNYLLSIFSYSFPPCSASRSFSSVLFIIFDFCFLFRYSIYFKCVYQTVLSLSSFSSSFILLVSPFFPISQFYQKFIIFICYNLKKRLSKIIHI